MDELQVVSLPNYYEHLDHMPTTLHQKSHYSYTDEAKKTKEKSFSEIKFHNYPITQIIFEV